MARIFSKPERELLSGIARGTVLEANGVPVQKYGLLVQEKLTKSQIYMETSTIYQVIHWKSNKQPVWQALYDVLRAERPDLITKLLDRSPKESEMLTESL